MADPIPSTFARRAMESEVVTRIYESRLWRRSLVVRAVLGLSFDDELDRIFRAAGLDREGDGGAHDVLDLACGSGIYTRPIARRRPEARVVGLDLSPPMLAVAGRLAARETLPHLHFVRGDAQRLPFSDARFDLVNCCGALHLFPEPKRALAEIARVLRPGGRFTAAVVRRVDGTFAPVASLLQRLGVISFAPDELERSLREVGLVEMQLLHARALWLVLGARRAAAATTAC